MKYNTPTHTESNRGQEREAAQILLTGFVFPSELLDIFQSKRESKFLQTDKSRLCFKIKLKSNPLNLIALQSQLFSFDFNRTSERFKYKNYKSIFHI